MVSYIRLLLTMMVLLQLCALSSAAVRHWAYRSSLFGGVGPSSRGRGMPFRYYQYRYPSYQQHQRAVFEAQRQSDRMLQHQRRIIQSGRGQVRPGTASQAHAQERRASDESLKIGNQALQQILYLQQLQRLRRT